MGRAPSLKRRDTSGERESLLSEEGAEEEDGHDNLGRAGPNRRPKSLEQLQASTLCPSMIGEHSDCNGMTLTCSPDENADAKDDVSLEDDFDEDVSRLIVTCSV